MNNSSDLDPDLIEQATEWLVQMSSDECTAQQRQDFAAWQQQSPQHQAAVERMQQMVDKLTFLQQPVSSQIIQQALSEQPAFKFEPKIRYFFMAFLAILAVTIACYIVPIKYWTADSKTGYDIWRNETLADESTIKMSGHSAYNLHFDRQQRRVDLLNGNILVDVAKDTTRPFVVTTEFAEITALGTRFMINHSNEQTLLTMLDSKVRLKTAQHTQIIYAGQQASIDKNGRISIKTIAPKIIEQAWDAQSLAVEDMPLNQVLDILQSYQRGKIYYHKEDIKHLKVTAILPLNQKNKAFFLLQDSLPIHVMQSIPYITTIQKK